MTFTEEIWGRTARIRESIYELPFVQALGDGTLSAERFHYYLAQDCQYLAVYGRVMAGLGALTPDPDELVFWSECARDTITVERSLHAARIDVPVETTPSPTCRAYSSFLLAQLQSGSYGQAVAAVLPCFWIYQDVGERLVRAAGDLSQHPYGDWLSTYTDPVFAAQTLRAREIADQAAQAVDEQDRERMFCAFELAAKYEWMFWDAAWRMEGWPV